MAAFAGGSAVSLTDENPALSALVTNAGAGNYGFRVVELADSTHPTFVGSIMNDDTHLSRLLCLRAKT